MPKTCSSSPIPMATSCSGINPAPATYYAKARYFDAAGQTKEAIAEIDKALAAAKPDTSPALIDELKNVRKTLSEKKG